MDTIDCCIILGHSYRKHRRTCSWRHSSVVGHNKDSKSGFVENSVCKSSDMVDLFIVATRVCLPPSADCSVIYLTCVAHHIWHSCLYYFFEANSNSWNMGIINLTCEAHRIWQTCLYYFFEENPNPSDMGIINVGPIFYGVLCVNRDRQVV